ncbi:MAG: hypothetical protein ACJ70S_07775 [Nitrososphaera sp.]
MSEKDLESLGWNDLVAQKRQLTSELKELSDKLIDIDKNQLRSIGNSIKEQRSHLDSYTERLKHIRSEVDDRNSELLSVSEKLSQSRNFLSMMESRIPSEKEEELRAMVQKNQDRIDAKDHRSEREKDEILSRIKDATMELEAIKATRTIRDQFSKLSQDSVNINNAIKKLNEERNSIRGALSRINASLDGLYNSKRKLTSEHQMYLIRYDNIAKQFDTINARLDSMSEMRRKQRKEYGYVQQNDALFKVKEEAKKKLQAGSKLSLDELKLLYGDKD